MPNEPTVEQMCEVVARACGIPPYPHWYCRTCHSERNAKEVTYTECCDHCGDGVEWKQVPAYNEDPKACEDACKFLGVYPAIVRDRDEQLGWSWFVDLDTHTTEVFEETIGLAMLRGLYEHVKGINYG